MLVDSHCHIAGPEFVEDLDHVISRAREAGVGRAFVILAADDEPELQQANAVSARWGDVRFSIGVHPHAAGKFASEPKRLRARSVARWMRSRSRGQSARSASTTTTTLRHETSSSRSFVSRSGSRID